MLLPGNSGWTFLPFSVGANTEQVQGQLQCDIGIVFSTARAFAALSLEG
ncbi:hypothetical protein AK812_SmicGene46317, partial [Symbiodinium microadriaticum]